MRALPPYQTKLAPHRTQPAAMLVQAKNPIITVLQRIRSAQDRQGDNCEAASAELKMVVLQADNLYDRMGLEEKGLSEEAF